VKVAPCRSALRAHPACPDQRGPRFVHNRRGSGPVVMVKNEELVASTATALEYLSLVKGNRGRMGSMRFRWARHAGGECYRLKDIASELAKDIFYDINRCDGESLSVAERSSLLSRQGVLAYICEPNSLRELLEHNIRIAHVELQERIKSDQDDKESPFESTVMICISWGAAPEQAGGRSAERRYVDVVVHMSAEDALGDDQTVVRILKPTKKKSVQDRNLMESKRGGPGHSEITVMASPEGELAALDFSQLVVLRGQEVLTPLEDSTDVVCNMATLELAKRGFSVCRRRLLVEDLLQADEILVVGSLPLCISVSRMEVGEEQVWEREKPSSYGQAIRDSLRSEMLARTVG